MRSSASVAIAVVAFASACAAKHTLTDASIGDAGLFDGGTSRPGIYVTNTNSTITVFALDASGDAAPLQVIGGPSTGLSLPIGIAVDHHDDVYVANRTGGTITVYPSTANGDVAPKRTLTATGMMSPEALALGPGDDLYAATCPSCGSSAGGDVGIYHFPVEGTASDGAITGASTGLTNPGSMTITGAGDIVAGNAFGGTIERFHPGTTGDVGPASSFTPSTISNLQSVAHATSTLVLTSPGRGLDFYDPAATGTAAPTGSIAAGGMLPLSYPGGLFVDTTASPEMIYFVDAGAGAVYVITTAGSEPNLTIASVRTISGASTMLNGPLDITIVR